MALSADERKLLRRMVTDRAAKAAAKVRERAEKEELAVPTVVIPVPAEVQGQVDLFNAEVVKQKERLTALHAAGVRVVSDSRYHDEMRAEDLVRIRKVELPRPNEEVKAERNAIHARRDAQLEAIDAATDSALLDIVAGGISTATDEKLKAFAEKLTTLAGE